MGLIKSKPYWFMFFMGVYGVMSSPTLGWYHFTGQFIGGVIGGLILANAWVYLLIILGKVRKRLGVYKNVKIGYRKLRN